MLRKVSIPTSETPNQPGPRNTDSKLHLPSKRKRESVCGLGTFNKPFTIRPSPESFYEKPYTFKPVRIISRSQLPLSLLDTSSDDNFATNRLFSASINILEDSHSSSDSENAAPKVLIARYESKRTLYAVERVQAHVYSLCRLAAWLKEREVTELWDPEKIQTYPVFPRTGLSDLSGKEWWKHAIVDVQLEKKSTERARLSMLRAPPDVHTKEQQQSQQGAETTCSKDPKVEASATVPMPDRMELRTVPTPQEQLENLVDQYLNSLYMSKTSLAYFAKGPIARIRNTFTSSEEGAPTTYELVVFLRSMLLSHKAEDKKYKEKLPELIQALPPSCFSDEDLADFSVKPRKSKKKLKLSREGMYPQEAEIVKRWWFGGVSTAETSRDEPLEQRIRKRLSDLRVREALLQMILILEVVALESLSTYKGPEGGDKITAETSKAAGDPEAKSTKRKKKLDNVNLLLDLLLDKLCIWQSVEQEGLLDFDTQVKQDDKFGTGSHDRLQSFCVEVVVPFYMNRLPEQARTINKKLGGPALSSPPKRKAVKPPLMPQKPGEPKEPESKKPRRSLGRIATDTTGKTGHARATPSLGRSATDSTVIRGIKRECSEVPLSAVPFQRSPSNAARQSMSHLKLLKGREVDLGSTSGTSAARMRQRKKVEEDLKEAISALKKPNRELAASSYADDIEKRGLGLTNKSRKPANPVRKIIQDVQVTVTPRMGKRTKNIVEQTPIHQRNPFPRSLQSEALPSSDFCIPSSAVRPAPSRIPSAVGRSGTARTLAPPVVAETPSKPSARSFIASTKTDNMIFATPMKKLDLSPNSPIHGADTTPTKAMTSSPQNSFTTLPHTLFETPVKGVSTPSKKALPTVSDVINAEEPSIYDALGWNDDDDFV